MGTPPLDDYIPSLYDYAGNTIAALVRTFVKNDQPVLDIGAGWGKYRWLLPEYTMDAVEVFKSEITKNNLNIYYRSVFNIDVAKFKTKEKYGAAIFGDVLEHLTIADAQATLDYMTTICDHIFVVVPYEMEQGPVGGNQHEIHIQDDLTPEIMESRYPQLKFYGRDFKANVYMWSRS